MPARRPPPGDEAADWRFDCVTTEDGVRIPVRATAQRPTWDELPAPVQVRVETTLGSCVVAATSTGSGFTSGFASALTLEDGRRVFVKAASSALDRRSGWQLTQAYREEIRKLTALPSDIGAPALLWSLDAPIEAETWVVLGLEHVDGRPPRRPWSMDELGLVTDMLRRIAPRLATVPAGLVLGTFDEDFGGWEEWLAHVEQRDGGSRWLDEVASLAAESVDRCAGSGIAHLDLRDDNILIDSLQRVWICDWNFPLLAAPWVDLVTLLLSAHGDGLDVEPILASHPLTGDVEPRSVNALLASLWLYFTTMQDGEVPPLSPHLRDHQRWYAGASRDWLARRLRPRLTSVVSRV